jgi:non-specific serine/threonine protein kinase/serine/threonine-protein kinase
MSNDRMARVSEVLEQALAVEAWERAQYLDAACSGDSELRAEVESLIASHERAGAGFLGEGWLGGSRIGAGRRVGPYLIVERIGRGGMGEVFAAVRADGQYEQKVALKVVRGFASAAVVERFRAERQILAGLDHPNIARLLDGGTTDDGAPYLVMELVDGVPIDEFCLAHEPTVAGRLQLFLRACSAVQYAHQRLVIHRDIKPSNIFVTAGGVPKLLDFGIAKMLDAVGNAPETLMRPFTPEYASPEQVRGEPVSTATDVYSLAVVLYQLLTGRSPYKLETHTPEELVEAVKSREPERPSPAILRGDLDFILLKALRKEPAQRYGSVEQFADDIRRHLDGLPVTARRGTWNYFAGKFVRRHRAGVAAVALVLITLLSGIVVTVREARIAEANRRRADARFNDVRELANSLVFEVHDSISHTPGTTAARRLILERGQQYLDRLARDSGSDPSLLRELAAAYAKLANVQGNSTDANLGDLTSAVKNYRKAAELLFLGSTLEPTNPETLRQLAHAYRDLGLALSSTADKAGSKATTERALQILEPMASAHPEDQELQFELGATYRLMGTVLTARNDLSQAVQYFQRALPILQRLVTVNPVNREFQRELSFVHKHMGAVLAVQKQLPAALAHYRAALSIDEADLSADPGNYRARYNVTFTYSDTGWILTQQGDLDAALDHYNKALQIRQALVAADPNDVKAREGVSDTYGYLAWIFGKKGESTRALHFGMESLAIRQALLQKEPANERFLFKVAESEAELGQVYVSRAKPPQLPPDQLESCRQAVEWIQKALPVFQQREAQGRLVGGDVGRPEVLARLVDDCNRMIARMTRSELRAIP